MRKALEVLLHPRSEPERRRPDWGHKYLRERRRDGAAWRHFGVSVSV